MDTHPQYPRGPQNFTVCNSADRRATRHPSLPRSRWAFQCQNGGSPGTRGQGATPVDSENFPRPVTMGNTCSREAPWRPRGSSQH